jgi:hypothetical protein
VGVSDIMVVCPEIGTLIIKMMALEEETGRGMGQWWEEVGGMGAMGNKVLMCVKV